MRGLLRQLCGRGLHRLHAVAEDSLPGGVNYLLQGGVEDRLHGAVENRLQGGWKIGCGAGCAFGCAAAPPVTAASARDSF